MKKILIVFAVVIVLVVGGLYFLLSNLDSVVAKAIEKHGSEVTQTSVTVSGVDISLREGRGSIKGLKVASPDGFGVRDAFSLGDITLDIDIQSLGDDPVVIDEIRILAPVVNVEATETGATNIDELRKNVEESAGGNTGDGGGSGGQGKRIRIKKFVFEKGSIHIDASAMGLEKCTVVLPEINLIDVGGTSGATPDEITRIILAAVVKKAAAEVAESGVKELIRKRLGDETKSLLDKIGN